MSYWRRRYQQGGTNGPVLTKLQWTATDGNVNSGSTSPYSQAMTPEQKKAWELQKKQEAAAKLDAERAADDKKGKEYLKKYYEHAVKNIPFYHDLTSTDSFNVRWERRKEYKDKSDRLWANWVKDPNSYIDTDSLQYYEGYPQKIKNPTIKSALEKDLEDRFQKYREAPIRDLMKPDSALQYYDKEWEKGVKGDYDPKTNITRILEGSERFGTLAHERSHKADRSKIWKGESNNNYLNDIKSTPIDTDTKIRIYDNFDYFNNWSERQARHRTTQIWLSQNFPGYDMTKPITEKEYDFLMNNEKKLPMDVNQLLAIYGKNKELFLKNINSFKKGGMKKQTGGTFKTQDQVNDFNAWNSAFLARKGASQWDVQNSYVGRQPGDAIPQFEYPQGRPANVTPTLRTKLPYGVTPDKVFQTNQGQYGYMDPQQDTFVQIDPASVFAGKDTKSSPQSMALAKNVKGGKYQEGAVVNPDASNQEVPNQFGQLQTRTGWPDTSGFDFSAVTQVPKRQFDPFHVNPFGYGLMAANLLTSSLLNKSNDRNYDKYRTRWIRDYGIPSNLQDPNKFGDEMAKRGGEMQQGGLAGRTPYSREAGDQMYKNYLDFYLNSNPKVTSKDDGYDAYNLELSQTMPKQSVTTKQWVRQKLKDGKPVEGLFESYDEEPEPSPKWTKAVLQDQTNTSSNAEIPQIMDLIRSRGMVQKNQNGVFQRPSRAYQFNGQPMQTGGMTMNTPEQQGAGYFAYPDAAYLRFPGSGERTFVPGPFPIEIEDDNGKRILKNKPLKTKGPVTERKLYQEGGEVINTAPKVKRSEATIEAEKGELIFGAGSPGSIEDQKDRVGVGLFKIGGQKHYNGGTPLKAFPGDFVFSNDPKLAFSEEDAKDLIGDKITKKKLRTPAKLAKKFLNLNENIQNAQDKDLDDITKKTAIYNVNNFMNKLADIAYAQEEQKGFPTGVPDFVQTSLQGRGFDTQGLQGSLNQMKRGGEIKKFQQGSQVTEEQFKKARKHTGDVPKDFKYLGDYNGNSVYMNSQGQLVRGSDATPSKKLAPSNEQYLKDIIKRDPNLQYSPSSELTKQGWGNANDPLWKVWDDKYYKPRYQEDYLYTEPAATGYQQPQVPEGPGEPFTSQPRMRPDEPPLDNFASIPNNKFNVTFPEAFSIYAATKPYKSRYPTAFRNYEIQNAKSLIASNAGEPSVEPYLSAIRRSQLGADDNQGNFAAGLTAQNQAINQVYNQKLARRDQQRASLANLEVQDGVDRITNFEKYDSKLETLANNKELADKYKNANLGNIFNTMGETREAKALFNVMSDYYQINRDNSFGLKPSYKIKNGRLEPYQRNVGDLIRQAGTTSNSGYMNQLENTFKLMRQYGITSLRDVNDVMGSSVIPPFAK